MVGVMLRVRRWGGEVEGWGWVLGLGLGELASAVTPSAIASSMSLPSQARGSDHSLWDIRIRVAGLRSPGSRGLALRGRTRPRATGRDAVDGPPLDAEEVARGGLLAPDLLLWKHCGLG